MGLINGTCYECSCSNNANPISGLLDFICSPIVCNATCQKGFEYETVSGQCCGKCVQKKCIFTASDNTVKDIEVGRTSRDVVGDAETRSCVDYMCKNLNGQFVVQEVRTVCPAFNPSNCEDGTERTDAGGCCKTCTPKSFCNLISEEVEVIKGDCKTKFNQTSCVGGCASYSKYSAREKRMDHKCECCRENQVVLERLALTCEDGSKIYQDHQVVKSCQCTGGRCIEWETGGTTR
ncbi:intestinal mucin-like protein [Brachionichthys hirsutus]|uniref:intestinal mucin-like protein n=1 Tax=Brachionichthys hirsutus TaxID=412623 RepID=UPI003604C6B1